MDAKWAVTVGAALVAMVIGLSLSWLGTTALNATARQPEAGARLQTMMLIAAALIEGIGLFCAVICFMAL